MMAVKLWANAALIPVMFFVARQSRLKVAC